MDITSILGPVSVVEAAVIREFDRHGGLIIEFPTEYLKQHGNRFGVIRPGNRVNSCDLIGKIVAVHVGNVYINDNGNSGPKEMVIKAYDHDGVVVADHAPMQTDYECARAFYFSGLNLE